MKLKKKSKILVSILVFVFIISTLIVVSNSNTDGIDTSNLDSIAEKLEGKTYSYKQLFDNTNVFCIENGKPFGTDFNIDSQKNEDYSFNVSETYNVTDPGLIYILNLPDDNYNYAYKDSLGIDEDRVNHHNFGVKQNLIWWYLKDKHDTELFEDSNGNKKTPNDLNLDTTALAKGANWENEDFSNANYLMAPKNNMNTIEDTIGDHTYCYSGIHTYLCEYTIMKQKISDYVTNIDSKSIAIKDGEILINTDTQKAEFTITGSYDSFEIYLNDSENVLDSEKYTISETNGEKKVCISLNEFSGDIAKVKVKGYYKGCEASLCVISNEYSSYQKIICTQGIEKDIIIDTVSVEKEISTNISLQKYITQVNGKNITETDTELTSRRNKMTSDNETSTKVKTEISKNNTALNEYKKASPVKIAVGDRVTYLIEVYNNSDVNAENIIIRDIIPSNASIVSATTINENNVEKTNNSDGTYDFRIPLLNANRYTYIKVILEFNTYKSGILSNTAWIYDTNPDNDTDYRTVDRDYVEMIKPNVSLQKYIIGVNVNGNTNTNNYNNLNDNNTSLIDRENRRTKSGEQNVNGKLDEISSNNSVDINDIKYKYDNPVNIEVGDTVTYRIWVYNNSRAKADTVIVRDNLPYYNNYGQTISYVNIISIKNHENEDISYSKYEGNLTTNPNTYEWTINNLEGNAIVYFDVTLEFISHTSEILPNTAWITGIVPQNEYTYRTVDRDYIQMSSYSVSLEKYVSAVNGTEIDEDRSGKTIYSTDNGKWKENAPVQVEIGDTVTYTLKLTNTGDKPIKISRIGDMFQNKDTAKLTYINNNTEYGTSLTVDTTYPGELGITINNPTIINPNESAILTLDFKVEVPYEHTNEEQTLVNTAVVTQIKNSNDKLVADSDGVDNNRDSDWIKTKLYEVSLEKYVSHVNGGVIADDRSGKAEYLTNNNNEYVDETLSDTEWTRHNTAKYDDVVTVGNGDYVTYTIRVTNDGDTAVRINEIKDILPEFEISEYKIGGYTTDGYSVFDVSEREITINRAGAILLESGESTTVYITVKVNEPNTSLRTITNTAKVEGFKNRNDVDVLDSTPYNNEDSDYINLKDIIISGTVWNDRAFDKNSSDYNGIFDTDKEVGISGIKVELYEENNTNPIATTTTGDNGQYTFKGTENLSIKASKVKGTNRWDSYKSYYIKYEYDGITYTSTVVGEGEKIGIYNDVYNDSNAQETLTDRIEFNNKFSNINNESGIEYTTKNEDGFIPQSNHIYNPDTMAIKSSTSLVNIGNKNITEERLQHINLGLRGRDTFDLELTDDIYSTRVTVNGVQGVYNYNNNEVTIRHEDIQNGVVEDAANIANHTIESAVSEENQNVRETDISKDENLKIEITYKLTIKNPSKTDGTATKVIDYYDDKYTFIKAYHDLNNPNNTLNWTSGEKLDGFESVIINSDKRQLSDDSNIMEIYVVFELRNDENTANDFLKGLEVGEKIATYNIAEIYEYTTSVGQGQTEFTRGLIDVDTAPGSANREQVRLKSTEGQNTPTKDGNPTTIEYYFNKKLEGNEKNPEYLKSLKYEDDTYTAPILYFVTNDNKRVIEGVVFEDETSIDYETKIKTGNGKLDEGEVGVYGANVQLIELKEETLNVVQEVTTNEKGEFKFEDFIPGKYIIRYSYGDTTNTVLLHQNDEKTVNRQSYNGEDYQATNNTGKMGNSSADWLYKLNDIADYWYVYNEKVGISTAIDNLEKRNAASEIVTNFTDVQMTALNNMRDLVGTYDFNTDTLTATKKYNTDKTELIDLQSEIKVSGIKDIIENTKMYAETQSIFITVEKTEDIKTLENSETLLNNRDIVVTVEDEEKGILLGEWAIFPDDSENSNSPYKSYAIRNMNFGIAEVPVTTIDLQKEIQSFTIKDATGKNVIASLSRDENGEWKLDETVGSVIPLENDLSVSIEDEKLQGARLEITFNVKADMQVERNFDNTALKVPTIVGMVDFINNNLSYNSSLGENSKYWELTDNSYLTAKFGEGKYGTVETSDGSLYTVKVKATENNPLSRATEGTVSVPIVLERILTSTDSTIEDIITSTVDTFEYSNIVEIVEINYNETSRDRIRTPERYIIIPGQQYDSAKSTETLVIHPPTGTNDIDIVYYVIALISLIVLAGGIIGIKKYVVKK